VGRIPSTRPSGREIHLLLNGGARLAGICLEEGLKVLAPLGNSRPEAAVGLETSPVVTLTSNLKQAGHNKLSPLSVADAVIALSANWCRGLGPPGSLRRPRSPRWFEGPQEPGNGQSAQGSFVGRARAAC